MERLNHEFINLRPSIESKLVTDRPSAAFDFWRDRASTSPPYRKYIPTCTKYGPTERRRSRVIVSLIQIVPYHQILRLQDHIKVNRDLSGLVFPIPIQSASKCPKTRTSSCSTMQSPYTLIVSSGKAILSDHNCHWFSMC